ARASSPTATSTPSRSRKRPRNHRTAPARRGALASGAPEGGAAIIPGGSARLYSPAGYVRQGEAFSSPGTVRPPAIGTGNSAPSAASRTDTVSHRVGTTTASASASWISARDWSSPSLPSPPVPGKPATTSASPGAALDSATQTEPSARPPPSASRERGEILARTGSVEARFAGDQARAAGRRGVRRALSAASVPPRSVLTAKTTSAASPGRR